MQIKRGRTSQIIPVRILDITSVSGAGKTGLTNASANLTAYYHRELDTTATAISLVSTTSGVYSSGGFVETDATHLAGQYELSIPATAIGSGDASTWVEVMIYDSGTSLGIAPSVTRIDLVAYDPQDATRLGLTALPNANAASSGGLPVRDANGNVAAAPDWSHVTNPTTTVDLSGTTIKNVDNAIANVTTVATTTNLTNAPTAGDFTAAMKTSLNAATPASVTGAVGSVTGNVGGSVGSVVATVSANLTQILGTALTETAGQLAAGFKKWFNVATPTSTMNEVTLVDTTTNLTNSPSLGAVWDELAANHTLAGSFGLLLGSGSATAAAIWNYVIASTLSAGATLSAIYQKTLASPIQFINPFIVVNHTLGPIVAGDAYTLATNRQIDLPVPGNVPINDITANPSTLRPYLKLPNEDGTEQTIIGTAVQISSQWYARFELTSTETATLAISSSGSVVTYGAKATALADNTILTVQQGPLIVVRGS